MQLSRGVFGKKLFTTGFRTIQDDGDVLVARFPRVAQKFFRFALEQRSQFIAKPVERLPQRGAPILVPSRVTATIAAAIGHPAANPVHTAPGTRFMNMHFMLGRVILEIFAIIRKTRELLRFDVLEGIGQSHLSMAMMVAVGFSVRSNIHELFPLATLIE